MVERGIWYKGESKNYYSLQEAVIYFLALVTMGEEDCVLHVCAAPALSIALGAMVRARNVCEMN